MTEGLHGRGPNYGASAYEGIFRTATLSALTPQATFRHVFDTPEDDYEEVARQMADRVGLVWVVGQGKWLFLEEDEGGDVRYAEYFRVRPQGFLPALFMQYAGLK